MIPPPDQPADPARQPQDAQSEPQGSRAAAGRDEGATASPSSPTEQSAECPALGSPIQDPQPGCVSASAPDAARARLLDELAGVHAEREDLIAAADGKAWREGAILLQLVAEFGLSAREIATEMNARASVPRATTRERWVQRLVEVQRVFPTSESRVVTATWKNHAGALDLARIALRLEGVHVRTLGDDELRQLAAAAKEILVDALHHSGQMDVDPDRWLEQRRSELLAEVEAQVERSITGASRGPSITRPEGAALKRGSDEDDDDDDERSFGEPTGWRESDDGDEELDDEPLERAFESARSAVAEFLSANPTKAQINVLISMLRDARRKAE